MGEKLTKKAYLDRLRCAAVDGVVKRGKVSNYTAYEKWFDSFDDACASIGLIAAQPMKITKEVMLQRIREAAKDGVVRRRDIQSEQYLDKFWDSWADACREAVVQGKYKCESNGTIKRDCMMYLNDTECRGLNKMYCAIEDNCVFYKPAEEQV